MFSRTNIITALLFVLLLFFGTWHLSRSPATWFDEGINLGIAKSLVTHRVFSLETAPDTFVAERQFLITTNYPVLLPVALSLKLFGMNFAAARAPMVLFLLLFAAAAFALVKKRYSKEAAVMTLALIVTFLPLYGNGKDVLGEVPGLFYFLCALLLLPEEYSFTKLFFAGLFAGLSAATKPFFLIVPAALLVAEILAQRRSGFFWKRAGTLALGMALPIFFWLLTILPSFSLASIRSTFFYYGNSYASSDIGALIVRNALRFFTESTPLHFSLLFLAAAAFLYLKKRRGERMSEVEITFSVFTLLTLAFYLKTPGWYRYFFPAHLLLFLFFPAALSYLFNKKTAVIVAGILCIIQGAMLISKRHDSLYDSDEAIVFARQVMAETPARSDILFLNAPSAAFFISDRESYQYLQINGERHIGYASLVTTAGQPFPYVVVSEPLPDTALPNLRDTLARDYKLVDTVGHLNLYKRSATASPKGL